MIGNWFRLKLRETGVFGLAPALLRSAYSRVWRHRGLAVYVWPSDRPAPEGNEPVCARGRAEDFHAYRRTMMSEPSPEALIMAVKSRLHGDAIPYTRVEKGVLVHYGWVLECQYFAADRVLGLGYRLPPATASLFDFHTHPQARGKGLYKKTLAQIVYELKGRSDIQHLHISAYTDNTVSRHVIESVGFEQVAEIVAAYSFGRVSWRATWRSEPWRILPLDHPDAIDHPLSNL